jgi:hypothetical protein
LLPPSPPFPPKELATASAEPEAVAVDAVAFAAPPLPPLPPSPSPNGATLNGTRPPWPPFPPDELAFASADPETMVVEAAEFATPPLPPAPPLPKSTPILPGPPSPPAPPLPPVAIALFKGAVIGCALPALPVTDSPSPPGKPGSLGLIPSMPAAPSPPCTVTISARAPPAPIKMRGNDATPVINARVKIERWIDFMAAPPRRRRRFAPFENIQLRFQHYKAEISSPGHMRVWRHRDGAALAG